MRLKRYLIIFRFDLGLLLNNGFSIWVVRTISSFRFALILELNRFCRTISRDYLSTRSWQHMLFQLVALITQFSMSSLHLLSYCNSFATHSIIDFSNYQTILQLIILRILRKELIRGFCSRRFIWYLRSNFRFIWIWFLKSKALFLMELLLLNVVSITHHIVRIGVQ